MNKMRNSEMLHLLLPKYLRLEARIMLPVFIFFLLSQLPIYVFKLQNIFSMFSSPQPMLIKSGHLLMVILKLWSLNPFRYLKILKLSKKI